MLDTRQQRRYSWAGLHWELISGMKEFGRHSVFRDIATAAILLLVGVPVGVIGLAGLNLDHGGRPLFVWFTVCSILTVVGAVWTIAFGRNLRVLVTADTVEYNEPFRHRRIGIAELKSITVGADNDLLLDGGNASLIIPPTVFRDVKEMEEFKTMLRETAPKTCSVTFTGLVWNRQ